VKKMKEYEMTQEQLDKIMDACKPVSETMVQSGEVLSAQKNANAAWKALGKEMGFVHITVKPCGKGDRFFSAEPT